MGWFLSLEEPFGHPLGALLVCLGVYGGQPRVWFEQQLPRYLTEPRICEQGVFRIHGAALTRGLKELMSQLKRLVVAAWSAAS